MPITITTISPAKVTTNLRKRFAASASRFLEIVRRRSLAELEPHVMLALSGSPFIAPHASFDLRANGTFWKGRFSFRARSEYPSAMCQRVYLFASEEDNMAALRAEWFQGFAFWATTSKLEQFAKTYAGTVERPFWALDERELGELATVWGNQELFSPAITADGIEEAMMDTKTVLVALRAREELEHQKKASAHEKLSRMAARRALGMDAQLQLPFAA